MQDRNTNFPIGVDVRVPDLTQEAHFWRVERVVAREGERGGEDAAGKGGLFGAADQRFPSEEVVFGEGAGGDAVGGRGEEVLVFLEEAL